MSLFTFEKTKIEDITSNIIKWVKTHNEHELEIRVTKLMNRKWFPVKSKEKAIQKVFEKKGTSWKYEEGWWEDYWSEKRKAESLLEASKKSLGCTAQLSLNDITFLNHWEEFLKGK